MNKYLELEIVKEDVMNVSFRIKKQEFIGNNFFINQDYFSANNRVSLFSTRRPSIYVYDRKFKYRIFLYVRGRFKIYWDDVLTTNKEVYLEILKAVNEYNKEMRKHYDLEEFDNLFDLQIQ